MNIKNLFYIWALNKIILSDILTVGFQVVEADVFSADSLKTHFHGQDVIMSCLGFPISTFSPVTGYTQSMNAMISAMREAQVNRIITMTSWYTERKSCTHDDAAIKALIV